MTPQIRLPDLPQGFRTLSVDGATLIARDELMTPLTAAGLQTPEGWQRQLQARSSGPGRGAVQLLKVPGGALVLKQMRRGGSLARLWRDRYSGVGRLWDNLVVPLRVHERGIATAAPAALLIVPGPPTLYRGWLATWQLKDAEDLARRFASKVPPTSDQLNRVMELIRRMHDQGIDHPDLNLGNLMIRDAAGESEAFVVDLDRVRLAAGPLEFAQRQRALRRLERSFVKLFGIERESPDWYGRYAADDAELEARFRRGQAAGRLLQTLHRLGWRS